MTQPPKDKQPEPPPQRRNWAGAVAGDASIAARSVFTRAGFADPTLVMRWNEIAGPETARIARPVKFTEGPMGGIWFWTIYGTGIGAFWTYKNRPEVMYQT